MRTHSAATAALLLAAGALASVIIRKTNREPTGYKVDFRYFNTTAK